MKYLALIWIRIAGVLILAACLILGIATIRPKEGRYDTGLSREKFWLLKLEAKPDYDLVLTGDSRVLCDLDPTSIENELHGLKVLNYGFNYVGLSPEYLKAAVLKLNPRSAFRTILIGVTPRALTPLNAQVSGYLEESRRTRTERMLNWNLNTLNIVTRTISLSATAARIIGGQTSYKDYFPNGYMAVALHPADPNADLKVYQRVFLQNQVSSEITESLLLKIREMTQSGIRVIGIRLPMAPGIFRCEEQLSGFLEGEFARKFEQNGGIWLKMPAGAYVFCDGSHFEVESARFYSRQLALQISGAR